MKTIKLKTIAQLIFIVFIISLISSCSDDNDEKEPTDNFDRSAMLEFWSDEIIIPALENYDQKLTSLESATNDFVTNKDEISLASLRNVWLDAYKAWQYVAMFDIGKAEEIGYRNFVNLYPTDTILINQHIKNQQYNLELPSTFDAQGFPALDYLLYGLSDDTNEQLTMLGQAGYTTYLSELITRLKTLNAMILNDWESGFRDTFIANDGSSATASTDKTVNDFLFYYEKFFRAGKIGIPGGVFSGSAISNAVEAPYSGSFSKMLFFEAFNAIENFFNGRSFNGQQNGTSLKQYLDHQKQANDTEDIALQVNQQWQVSKTSAQQLLDNFKEQVEQDNIKMLETYDEIQKVVVLLKVDMMQALNIQVDFVDADGD